MDSYLLKKDFAWCSWLHKQFLLLTGCLSNRFVFTTSELGACGGAVDWGTELQAGWSRFRFPMVSVGIVRWRNPSGSTVDLGLTQPLTEMSTRNISWGVKVAGANNLTTFRCRLSSNVGISTSWNPQGLSRPVMGLHYLYQWTLKKNDKWSVWELHLDEVWLVHDFKLSPCSECCMLSSGQFLNIWTFGTLCDIFIGR
jgi:hypothetical protein